MAALWHGAIRPMAVTLLVSGLSWGICSNRFAVHSRCLLEAYGRDGSGVAAWEKDRWSLVGILAQTYSTNWLVASNWCLGPTVPRCSQLIFVDVLKLPTEPCWSLIGWPQIPKSKVVSLNLPTVPQKKPDLGRRILWLIWFNLMIVDRKPCHSCWDS